jgi:hypothetical protein
LSCVEKIIGYVQSSGEGNTETVLRLARKRAEELGIRDIVVASTRGVTGVKASETLRGLNVTVVTHSTGFSEPGLQRLTEENRRLIEKNGARILTSTHAFANVERAIKDKFSTVYPTEIIAQTLKIFGQGMKVVVEIAAMAADAGLIPTDRDVISIAGSSKGADTAVVIRPANTNRIFDMTVREIIVKPTGN